MTKKPKRPQSFIKTPGYPGGRKALAEFLLKNLVYPKQALKEQIQGKVSVKMEVDQKGKVTKAVIKHGIGYGCDEEAVRVCKLLKFEATKNRNVRATFHKSLTIPFILPKKENKPKENSGTIVYNYSEKDKKKTTYNYQIKL